MIFLSARQDRLHEEVLFEEHLLAFSRTQAPENDVELAKIFPSHGHSDCLHIGDRLDLLGVAGHSVQSQGRTPIVYDQSDVARQVEGLEPGVKIARMIDAAIRARRRFSRLTHPHQIGSQAAALLAEIGNNVPPKVGRGRVSVKKHDRVTPSRVDIAYLGIEHGDAPSRMRIGRSYLRIGHSFYLSYSYTVF